jgi:hypothetical protein
VVSGPGRLPAQAGRQERVVIAREDPGEFIAQFEAVFARANRVGLRTARQYTWQRVLERHLLRCIGTFDGLALDALRVACERKS